MLSSVPVLCRNGGGKGLKRVYSPRKVIPKRQDACEERKTDIFDATLPTKLSSVFSATARSLEAQKRMKAMHKPFGYQVRGMKYQIDPTAMRMETGKEAPCRRFYKEDNNMYSLETFGDTKTIMSWIQKTEESKLYLGVEKLKNDFEPERASEVDDVLDIFEKDSWWHRPEWFRTSMSMAVSENAEKRSDYIRDAVTPEGRVNPRANPIRYRIQKYIRMMIDNSYSVSAERLLEVLSWFDFMKKTEPDRKFPEGKPLMEKQILDTFERYYMQFEEDYVNFWRAYRPLENWQAPAGLADPDPHVDMKFQGPIHLFRDSFVGNSAIEDSLETQLRIQNNSWNPLTKVMLYTVSPASVNDKYFLLADAIKRREKERRDTTYKGLLQRPIADILYDHVPGWNHATHTWYHGRRLTLVRNAQEDSELMARYPEPLEEKLRHDAIPRHMQSFYQMLAFPDPKFSGFAETDAPTVAKMLASIKLTGDVDEATLLLPKHLQLRPEGEKRPNKRHWVYMMNPTEGHALEYSIRFGLKKMQRFKELTENPNFHEYIKEAHRDKPDPLRERGIAQTPQERAEAAIHHLNKSTSFDASMSYNPTLVAARRLWNYILHGTPGESSSMLTRTTGFLRAYAATPKESKYTFTKMVRETYLAYRVHLGAKKASLKRELGITEDKLRYMHDYLDEKQRIASGSSPYSTNQPASEADSNAAAIAELLSRTSTKTLSQPPKSHALPRSDIYVAHRGNKDSSTSLDLSRDDPRGHIEEEASLPSSSSFYDPQPSSTNTNTQHSTSASTPIKKQTRSYSTSVRPNSTRSFRPKRRLSKPWIIAREFHSSNSSMNFESSPEYHQVKGAFSRVGADAQGRVFANVTPRRTLSANTNRSKGSTAELARDHAHREMSRMMIQAQSALSESDLYALPDTKVRASSLRRPAESQREAYFGSKGKVDASDNVAPFPVLQYDSTPSNSSFLSGIRRGEGFTGAVWGISKAFGRVLGNLVRNAIDSATPQFPLPSTLEEDMSKLVEWQTNKTRTEMWNKFRSNFLTSQRSVFERLPELSDSFNVIYQSVHPNGEFSKGPTLTSDAEMKPNFGSKDFVLDYVRERLLGVPEAPHFGPMYPERYSVWLESLKSGTPESIQTEQMRKLIAANKSSLEMKEALGVTMALYDSTEAPEKSVSRISSIIETEITGKKKELENAAKHARQPLEGVSNFIVRNENGSLSGIDANALWNDPKVRFHSPEAWRRMQAEFELVDAELSEYTHRELQRRNVELSDFESMLFHMQPFVDRMIANPSDIKARIFYIMKLGTYSNTMQDPRWRPSDDKEAAWLDKFQDFDEDQLNVEVETKPYPMRKAPIIDATPSSLSEVLLQLGVTPAQAGSGRVVPDTYQAHIDYPFLYVRNDGTFIDLNERGELDPMFTYARSLAPPSDHIHQQRSQSPYTSLKQLLHADPTFIIKAWVRTLAHMKYQEAIRETWKPLSEDQDLPKLITALQNMLDEAKSLKQNGDEIDVATNREYETMRDLLEGMTADLKSVLGAPKSSASNLSGETSSDLNDSRSPAPASSTFKTIPTLEQSEMNPSEYFAFGSMVATLSDADCKTFVPPPMHDSYLEAASSPRSESNFINLITKMEEERYEFETKVESFIAASRPKTEYSTYNPNLFMPYERIPATRALSTRWRGTEPLILHAPLLPHHIAVGLMQYMVSLKRNLSSEDYRTRLRTWLSVRPELLPYIAKLSEYNEKFVTAVMNGEPLPHGEDLEKTFFHWTISDYVRHYTAGYIEDMRMDRLMALSDLHILLFGNDSEKQLLKQHRRDLQRKALVELEQKIAGTSVADALSTCPTVVASSQGGEELLEYTLSERIKNTFALIGKEMEGEKLMVPLNPTIDPTIQRGYELHEELLQRQSALEPQYAHLSQKEAAIQRYLDQNYPPQKTPAPTHVESAVSLPSELDNIAMLKARFLKHQYPIVAALPNTKSKSQIVPSAFGPNGSSTQASGHASPTPVPKDMLPLAGLDPSNWRRPVTAQDMTLQRLHLLPFDPENPATHGNYPYDWSDAGAPIDLGDKKNLTYASLLLDKPRFTLQDMLQHPLSDREDFLAEQDEGVKLARRLGDPDLVREAKFLFSVRHANLDDHSDERTIRLAEFIAAKEKEKLLKLKFNVNEPQLIPRRLKPSPNMAEVRARQESARLSILADQHAWIRKRYNSWLGQDPKSRTFDIASVLSIDNVSKRQRTEVGRLQARNAGFTDTPLCIPDPSTIWGPTQKSFMDLEKEIRFHLSLGVSSDIEEILEEERTKFISELEARLVAYRVMEKTALKKEKSERLGEVEKKLRHLELERKKASSSAAPGAEVDSEATESVLLDEDLLERIVREKEELLAERENLKQQVVAIESGKQTSGDDTWVRLQTALDALKGMSDVKAKRATMTSTSEEETAVVVAPPKTEEQEQYDEIMAERKKKRLEEDEAARTGKKVDREIPFSAFRSKRQMYATEYEDLFREKKSIKESELIQKRARGEISDPSSRGRFGGLGQRISRALKPTRGDIVIAPPLQPAEADVIWTENFGDHKFEEIDTHIRGLVQQLNCQILNGTPQVVRVNCHTEALQQIEKFYDTDYGKFDLVGVDMAYNADQRWAVRKEDGAYVATSVWFMPVLYTTKIVPDLGRKYIYRTDNTPIPAQELTLVGSAVAILETTPERLFHVTDWAFDMDIPDFPQHALPWDNTDGDDREELLQDDPSVRATMLPYGPKKGNRTGPNPDRHKTNEQKQE